MLKALPLSELVVVAVLIRAGDDDEGRPDFEYDVLNEKLHRAASFEPLTERLRCECCGQPLKYACEVVHVPTLKGYYVGRACAHKFDALRRYVTSIEHASVGLAERVACNARETAFRETQSADVAAALDWATTESASRFARDLRAKLRRFGALSPAQLGALLKGHEEHKTKLAIAATGVRCPEGLVELTGKVVSLKDTPVGDDRFASVVEHNWKMVLDLGNSVRVWGTCPEAVSPTAYIPAGASDPRLRVGMTVRLKATVTPAMNDPLFGYFSRPAKLSVVAE